MSIYDNGFDKWLRKGEVLTTDISLSSDTSVQGTGGVVAGGSSDNLVNDIVYAENITSGEIGSLLGHGKKNFSDTSAGILFGLDTDKIYKWIIGTPSSGADWAVTTPNTFSIKGSLVAGDISIGTSPNWFRVDNTGNTWWGAVLFANAPASVTTAGVCKFESGVIGGFTITSNSLYGSTIKTSANVGAGYNGVIIDTNGLRGYDSVLGNTFNLPTNGSAPTFSSGVINSTIFNINTDAVLRTSTTVGDGTASSAGILINNAGFYACETNQTLANANVKILVNGSANFAGSVTAESGLIGGFIIQSSYLEDASGNVGLLGSTQADFSTALTITSTGANDAAVGTQVWSTPTNIQTDGADYAIATVKPAGPGLPGFIKDFAVKIVKADGTVGTTNKASATNWITSEVVFTYGGASDLWGETLTPDDINDTDFGLVLEAYADYTPAAGIYTNYLKATNFGFAIPDNATILGVEFTIKHQVGFVNPLAPMYTVVYYIKSKIYYSTPPVRIWAGDSYADREIAPFRVYQNGDVYMKKIVASNLKLYDAVVDINGNGDYTDLQSAINSLPVTGGSIYIRSGTYNITSSITISKANLVITGENYKNTIIKRTSNDIWGIKISSGFDFIRINNIQLDGDSGLDGLGKDGIYADTASDLIVENCYIHHWTGTAGISINGGDRVNIKNNYCTNNDYGVYCVGGADQITINNNILNSNTVSGIYSVVAERFIIASNQFDGNSKGIVILAAANPHGDVVISNNIVRNSTSYGIGIDGGGFGQVWNALLVGNLVADGGSYGIVVSESLYISVISNYSERNTYDGIYIYDSQYCSFNNNYCYNNSRNGIYVNASNSNTINSNILKGNGSGASYFSIYLANTSTDNVVNGNYMNTTANYNYRENAAADDRNIVTSNRATGAATANISIQGAADVNANNIVT